MIKVEAFFSWLRNRAHDLIPLIGILLVSQGPVTTFLMNLNIDEKLISYGFTALGAFMTLYSKHIDSSSYTTIQAALTAATQVTSTPAVTTPVINITTPSTVIQSPPRPAQTTGLVTFAEQSIPPVPGTVTPPTAPTT